MSVTRQQLRQIILAEAVELTPIESTRPERAFQALAAANISAQYNEKLTQFTSDLAASVGEIEAARTIKMLADADMLRTLATMDTSEWEVIMTALSESANLTATRLCQLISGTADPSGDATLMTLGQFRKVVSEAMAYEDAYREITKEQMDWTLSPQDFVTMMGLYQATGATDASGFKRWLLLSDTLEALDDAGVRITNAYSRNVYQELSPKDPVVDPKFLEPLEPDPRRLGESTVMTVRQFRRLVREAAGGGDTGDIRDFLDDLNALGLNAANILDGLRADVYDDTDRSELANWLEGQPIANSWPLLMNWLDHREPELAREDLEGLLKLQMGSRDPHPAEDQHQLDESTVMTLRQFRKLIREASCDAWDPFDDLGQGRREVAAQLIADTRPDNFEKDDWEDVLRDYIVATGWTQGPPQALPETGIMDGFESAVKACAQSGGVSPDILKTAMLNILSGR